MLELDLSTIDAVTDEVILGVDVLAPVVVDGVFFLRRWRTGCPPSGRVPELLLR